MTEADTLFAVLDQMRDMAALVEDGRVVRANAAWWSLLGQGPRREQQPRLADLVHPDDAAKLDAIVEAGEAQVRLITRRHAEVTGALKLQSLPGVGALHIFRDLAEQNDLAELEPARVALAVLRDACDISLWRWDPITTGYTFDLDFSRPVESYKPDSPDNGARQRRLTGSKDGDSVSGMIHPDDAERVRESFTRTVTDGSVEQIEYRRQRPDGDWAHLSSAWRGVRETRKGWEVLGLTLDVSELAEARNAAMAAAQAKSQFLANMSHEIRTPMNGIIGMTALLLRTALTPDQKKFAEAVRVSGDSLLGIINDILDISKLEAGKVELEAIDFSLQKVVEDVIELMSPKAAEKSLELACYLDEGARRPFQGDPTRLRQVLLNLISNALKFTESGSVGVEVRSRRGSGGRTLLAVEVQDTGIGLSEEAKGKLFQTFSQADGSITRKFGGTGLGLAICRQLVTLMGGEIGVKDRPGGGAVFWFEVSLGRAEAAPRAVRRRKDLKGVRVLVVDDIDLNRSIFVRQLRDDGAISGEADGGAAALRMLREADAAGAPYDVVLLDHMMPEMSGHAVGIAIRDDARLTQPRVVLASSIGAPEVSERAAWKGFDAFLTKPIRHQDLIDCLTGLTGASVEAVTETPAALGAPEPAVAPDAASPPSDLGSAGRVLLAEDNGINSLLARTILEAAGFDVTHAGNGHEAIAAVATEAFDLILMDVHMPEMDGLTATRLIRAMDVPTARAPIIAMTANAMKSDQDACLEAGMDDFVSKPFEPDVFLGVVCRVLLERAAAGVEAATQLSA